MKLTLYWQHWQITSRQPSPLKPLSQEQSTHQLKVSQKSTGEKNRVAIERGLGLQGSRPPKRRI